MEQEKIKELVEAFEKMDDSGQYHLGEIIKYMEHIDDDDHFLEGVYEAIMKISHLNRIAGYFGDSFIIFLQSDREYLLEEGDGQFIIDQGELLIRFGSILRSFEWEQWTPEVKELFEKGLDFLANLLDIKSVPIPA